MTIVIIYSKDRLPQLRKTIACLDDVKGTADCEKILLVDGDTNIRPPGWIIEELPREGEFFNHSKAWNKAVELASHDTIWMLESDRIVPTDWLERVPKENGFFYPSQLYQLTTDNFNLEMLKEIREAPFNYRKLLWADHRISHPDNGIAKKNPMSGCVVFTKEVYEEMGRMDERYVQAGYHDLDAFRRIHQAKIRCEAIEGRELHLAHKHSGGTRMFKLVNLWNAVQYHKKWNLELHPKIVHLADTLGVKVDQMSDDIEVFVRGILVQNI